MGGAKRAQSEPLESESEEDVLLRARIQSLQTAELTIEEQGQQLYRILTESHREATEPVDEPITVTQKSLPPAKKILPRLIELPVEVVEIIAIRLDVKSLGEFRQSCKTLKVKSSHHFRREYFTCRVVSPKWESIRLLIMILNHPDLGSAVRDIIINTASQTHYPPVAAALTSSHHRVPISRRQLRRLSVANVIPNSQNLSMLLVRAFDKITIFRSLSFRALKLPSEAPTGYGKECSAHVLENALKALSESGKNIISLRLATGCSNIYNDFFHLPSLETNILTADKGLLRIFNNITTLEVGFCVSGNPTGNISKFPSQLLNMTPNLQNLTLSLGPSSSSDCYNTFVDLATLTSLTKLVHVELRSLELTTDNFSKFVMASKSTLRKITISDVQIQESPEMRLKPFLKNELALDSVRLKNLFSAQRGVWIEDVNLENGVWV